MGATGGSLVVAGSPRRGHDVRVCGPWSDALLNAMQKMSIEWIKPLPKRYERLATADAVFVAKVDVTVSTVTDP